MLPWMCRWPACMHRASAATDVDGSCEDCVRKACRWATSGCERACDARVCARCIDAPTGSQPNVILAHRWLGMCSIVDSRAGHSIARGSPISLMWPRLQVGCTWLPLWIWHRVTRYLEQPHDLLDRASLD